MGKSPDTPALPAVADLVPTGIYAVTVTAPIEIGGVKLGPMAEISATGEWLAGLLTSEFVGRVSSVVLKS